jgi:hypothetical protein
MKIEQSNKLKMGQTTLACLNHANNAPLWQGIGGLADAEALLDQTIQRILDCGLKQSERTGLATEKADLKQTMLNTAFTVCSGLKAYASASGDVKLADQVDFSRTDLAHGREADVVNRCKAILNLGNDNATALAAKYNVTANDLKALKNAIPAFEDAQPKPRQGRAASASATAELMTLFVQLDDVLFNQLDPLMEKFSQSSPAFYNEYQTARVIVDDAASHEVNAPAPQPAPAKTA